jgi:hypothetical protein
MDFVRSIGLTILLVVFFDWLFFTRVGGYFSDFDYRYWPLSRARMVSLLIVITSIESLVIYVHPDPENPPMWALVPLGIVMIFWITVGYRDIWIQGRTGYRNPPRYSDDDY